MSRDVSNILAERQHAIRREGDRRNISWKVVSFDSGIKYSTLLSYFPEDACLRPIGIPGAAIYALCGALPDDLLNLLAPDGYAIVRVPCGVDYDDVSKGCRDFLATKEDAHHPESEEGRELGPNERSNLDRKVVSLRAVG